jgi:hypothetical protein
MAGCQTAKPVVARGPLIVSPTACADFTATIYFERRSAHLNREADALLDEAVRRAHDCTLSGITIIGLADAPGTAAANLELSKARTNAVTRAMLRRRFMGFEFRSSPDGGAGVTRTSQASPLRRRVDVVFHLAPAARGAAQ